MMTNAFMQGSKQVCATCAGCALNLRVATRVKKRRARNNKRQKVHRSASFYCTTPFGDISFFFSKDIWAYIALEQLRQLTVATLTSQQLAPQPLIQQQPPTDQ